MAKAVLMLSGGLDSTLAGKLLLDMGIEVHALNYTSPFCTCTPKGLGCSAAKLVARELGIPVVVKGCGSDYLERMKRPRFGRGSGVNACIDCRVHLFTKAKDFMNEIEADFLATGEVLGERPMSQRREAMTLIERESGLQGMIVRPLSAQHLPPSIPEQSGLVDRARLKAISGRCRKPQLQLVEELSIKGYLCPGGGCLLTDRQFAARFRDLLEHEPDFGLHDARLLRYGRHFRLPGGTRIIVGRREDENAVLQRKATADDLLLEPIEVTGPTVLIRGGADRQTVRLAARVLASHVTKAPEADVAVTAQDVSSVVLRKVQPLERSRLDDWRVGVARQEIRT